VSAAARAGRRLATLLGLAALLVGVALLAATIGGFVLSRCSDGGEAQVGRLAVQLDAEADRPRLVATPPAAGERRPAVPVRIEIPQIGVRAPVIRLGLNADKSLEVPKDFGDTGWWSGGPRPGERGPAVIAGHVDSYSGPAVFYRLSDLRPHDAIVVVGRDGVRTRFSVIGSQRYPKDRFPTDRVYGATDRPTLRLITCGGDFDRSTGHYLDNTVVYARAA
jgi:sortase (surface protein transpeptidase)